jgi:hypothetical protein
VPLRFVIDLSMKGEWIILNLTTENTEITEKRNEKNSVYSVVND